ncbi:MAG: hypothetical protein GIKADHBN_01130 [Phycisphaerales bacterium]|nr:hypothetical protein [Phycisphaerales bacterium]
MRRPLTRSCLPTLIALAWAVVVLLCPRPAAGQTPPATGVLPGAGGMWTTTPPLESHGWMVAPWGDQWALVHVPPRVVRGSLAQEGFAAAGGNVRLVSMFKDAPVALAAVDSRAFVAFETLDRGGRVMKREVGSVTAFPSGLGAIWRFEPEAALMTHPLLPPDGMLVGLGIVDGRLSAVIDDSLEANPIGPRVGVLHRDRWLWAALEDRIASELQMHPGRGRVFSSKDGLGLAVSTPNREVLVWTGRAEVPQTRDSYVFGADVDEPLLSDKSDESPAQSPQPPQWSWTFQRFSLGAPAESVDLAMGTIMECSGVLLWIQPDAAGRATVYELIEGRATQLAEFPDATRPLSVTCLQDEGRLVLVWSQVEAAPQPGTELAPSSPKRKYEAREVSVATGRVLYAGPAKSLGPVSPTDLRILSTALLIVMGIALLLVLRPDPDDAVVSLPDGFALAESSRRMVAAMIDGVLAWWIAAVLWGLDVGATLAPASMVTGQTWYVAGTAIIVGIFLGTFGEWRAGRSPGKLLVGCEVISLVRRPDHPPEFVPRPGFWRALERNAVKWLLPPVAMLGLFDDQGRHRGDMLARTLVVIRYEPFEGDAGPEE